MHGKSFNADKADNSNRKSHSLPQSLNGDYKNSSRNLLTRQPNTLNKIENRTRAIVTSKPMFLSRKSEDSYSVNNNNLVFNSQPTFSVLEQSNQEFFGNPIASNSPKSFPSGKPVRIIPIGGVNEVGMNMTVLEYDDEMIVIDTGMGFGGGEKFPGVDYVIPDTSYIEQNRHKLKGIIYTHGHLDHIGGAPYILPKLGNVPIFGLPLTLGLLKNRLAEFELQDNYIMKVVELNRSLKLGNFTIHFFRLNHSIPDNFGMAIDTPMGRVLYCTDWKFDNTPFDGQLSDYAKLGRFGDEGVRLLMTDTLGALRPGYSMSEKVIGETINQIFAKAEGRILFTTFASTVARLQHVVNACILYNRKLVLLGRSMISTFNTAYELGKIKVPKGLVIEVNQINDLPPEKVAILLTGSQGEDNAALNRIARDEHPQIKLQGGDTVIFSSSAIPGNEESVQDLMSRIAKKGVEVLNHKEFDIHTSGHAAVEDIKMMLALTRPEYVQPIHGEYFMHQKLANIAVSMGMDRNNILIGENGQILEMRSDKVVLTDNRVTDSYVLVDGSGIGSVSQVVLEERKTMSSQGVIIVVLLINKQKRLVGGPETISRGFVYMKNNQELFQQLEQLIRQKFNSLLIDPKSTTYFSELRTNLKQIIGDFIYEKTEKNPMIIPVVVQV
jgi:ribonuclease J